MRHRRRGKILKRKKGPREAMIRSLARAIVLKNSIVTTSARAKVARSFLERLISKEKSGTLESHRRVILALGKDAAQRLRRDIVPSLGDRKSGFLRITKQDIRKSDASSMSRISLVQ